LKTYKFLRSVYIPKPKTPNLSPKVGQQQQQMYTPARYTFMVHELDNSEGARALCGSDLMMKNNVAKLVICSLILLCMLPMYGLVYGSTFSSYWVKNNSKDIAIYDETTEVARLEILTLAGFDFTVHISVTVTPQEIPVNVTPSSDQISISGGLEYGPTFNFTNLGVTTRTFGNVTFTIEDVNAAEVLDVETLTFVLEPEGVSVVIGASSTSISLGQTVLFTSAIGAGVPPPYSRQWYLNSTAVPDAYDDNWSYTPTVEGLHIVYLLVTNESSGRWESNHIELEVLSGGNTNTNNTDIMSKLGQRIANALNIQILKDNSFMTGLVTIAVSISLIVVEIICLFKWTRKETRK
jgi:hypothetical protein